MPKLWKRVASGRVVWRAWRGTIPCSGLREATNADDEIRDPCHPWRHNVTMDIICNGDAEICAYWASKSYWLSYDDCLIFPYLFQWGFSSKNSYQFPFPEIGIEVYTTYLKFQNIQVARWTPRIVGYTEMHVNDKTLLWVVNENNTS